MAAKGLKPNTIRNALRVLQRACNLLVRARVLDRNPVVYLGELIPRHQQSDEALYWTHAEVESLLGYVAEHEPRFAPLLRLALGTGLRLGELAGLHWSDVHFEKMELRVRRNFSNGEVGEPKIWQRIRRKAKEKDRGLPPAELPLHPAHVGDARPRIRSAGSLGRSSGRLVGREHAAPDLRPRDPA